MKDSGGTANGGVDTSASESFTITVAPVNDPPTATDDGPLTVGQNAGPTALAVLANDTASPDSGETLTIVAKTDGAHGSVAIVAGGAGVTYAPGPLFRGTDSFTYTVSDGGLTDTATVTVSVVQTGSVSRLAGADRYATAAAISAATFAPGVPVAYVATGLNFPDALAGAAAGGHRGGPVLLIDPNRATLPAATAAELVRLKPKSIVALGSSAVVPAAIVSALAFYTAP